MIRICFLILFISYNTYLFAQNPVYTGWKFLRLNGKAGVSLNKENPFQIDQFEIKTDSAVTQYNNTLNFSTPLINGMISVSLDVQNIGYNDTSFVLAYVEALDASDRTVTFDSPKIKRLLSNDSSGIVSFSIPFDRVVKKITVGVYLKGICHLKFNSLKLDITQGEFDDSWRNTYSRCFSKNTGLAGQLQTIAKVWGLLKYFSPRISKENIDWDRVLIDNIDTVFKKGSNENFNCVISRLINVGTYQNITASSYYDSIITTSTELEKINAASFEWLRNSTLLSDFNKSTLLSMITSFRPFENKYVKLSPYSRKVPQFLEDEYTSYLPEYRYRLLTLFRYWNIMEYYNPNKYLIRDSWPNTLPDLISEFVQATSTLDYNRCLLKLNATIKDGHSITSAKELYTISISLFGGSPGFIPFKLYYDKGKVFVTKIDSAFGKVYDINVRDEIVEINGLSAKLMADSMMSSLSHSEKRIKEHFVNKYNMLAATPVFEDSLVSIKYKRGKESKLVSLKIDQCRNFLSPDSRLFRESKSSYSIEKFAQINDTTFFINAANWVKGDLDNTISLMKQSSYLILDLRKRPTLEFVRFAESYFFDKAVNAIRFLHVTNCPSVFKQSFVVPAADANYTYKKNLIVLMSEETASMPETLIMYFKVLPKEKLTLIGRNTMGANGTNISIPMIGSNKFTFSYSSVGVFFPDNTQTQGIGIKPDIYVEKTLDEAISNEDKILNTALLWIADKKKG